MVSRPTATPRGRRTGPPPPPAGCRRGSARRTPSPRVASSRTESALVRSTRARRRSVLSSGRVAGAVEAGREAAPQVGRDRGHRRGRVAPRMAAVGEDQHHAGADDAEADLACARDREQEGLARVGDAVGGDDDCGVAGQRRAVAAEVAQHGGAHPARAAPQGECDQEAVPTLREGRHHHHQRRRADACADQAARGLAERGAEHRLADDGGRCARPGRLRQLQPERDEQGDAHGRPHAQPEGDRRRRPSQPGQRPVAAVDRFRPAQGSVVRTPQPGDPVGTQMGADAIRATGLGRINGHAAQATMPTISTTRHCASAGSAGVTSSRCGM